MCWYVIVKKYKSVFPKQMCHDCAVKTVINKSRRSKETQTCTVVWAQRWLSNKTRHLSKETVDYSGFKGNMRQYGNMKQYPEFFRCLGHGVGWLVESYYFIKNTKTVGANSPVSSVPTYDAVALWVSRVWIVAQWSSPHTPATSLSPQHYPTMWKSVLWSSVTKRNIWTICWAKRLLITQTPQNPQWSMVAQALTLCFS